MLLKGKKRSKQTEKYIPSLFGNALYFRNFFFILFLNFTNSISFAKYQNDVILWLQVKKFGQISIKTPIFKWKLQVDVKVNG